VRERRRQRRGRRRPGEGEMGKYTYFVVGNGEQNDFTRFERVEEFESCGCDRGTPERT